VQSINRNYFSDFLFPYILQWFQRGKFALPDREICGKWRETGSKWRDDKPIPHGKVDQFIVQG
jgi:hypothetical protein